MKALSVDNRATRMIVLENVCSALTSHVGRDFAALGAALSSRWYRFGGLVIDARSLLPCAPRPRPDH
jgi:DNA (cytosine-5)-methyltransferase 1